MLLLLRGGATQRRGGGGRGSVYDICVLYFL